MGWFSDLVSPIGHFFDNATGVTANYNNRMANEQAQAAQQTQLAQQQQIAATQAAKVEEQQKAVIDNTNLSRSSIDSAFSQFNDPYYAGLAKKYSDFYNPQIDEQYGQALDAKTGDLAERGMLKSTVGANTLALLSKTSADKKAEIANSAQDFANQSRGSVQAAKDSLYGMNLAASDPSQIASQATGSATALAGASATSPTPALGDVFSSFLTPATNAIAANGKSLKPGGNGAVSMTAPTTGAGSSQMIA